MTELEKFGKYKERGAYHWQQIGYNIRKRNAFVIARYANCISLLKQHVEPGSRVLDAGCGDGVFSYLINKEGFVVDGVDYADEAVSAAREQTQGTQDLNYHVGSVYELPFEDDSFDAAVSTEVIEHLEDRDTFLSELKRVVKPGGTIIVTTPIRLTRNPLDPEHVIEWFKEDYEEYIQTHFSDVRFATSHPVVWMDIYQARYFGQLLGRATITLLSFVWNPFKGFSQTYGYQAIQYAIARNN